jgi:group I intron endonuclease
MTIAPHTTGVYYILNLKNNRIYVGESIDIASRWRGHRADLRGRHHKINALQADWDTFGELNFEFGILTTVPRLPFRHRLREIERIFIHAYQASDPLYGYNGGVSEIKNTKTELNRVAAPVARTRKPGRKPNYKPDNTRAALRISAARRQRRKATS